MQSLLPDQLLVKAEEEVSHRTSGHFHPHASSTGKSSHQLDWKFVVPACTIVAGGKQCASRSTITPTKSCHSNRMVFPSRGLPSNMLPVAPTPSGPVCHQIQQQTVTVCVTSAGPPGLGSGCPQIWTHMSSRRSSSWPKWLRSCKTTMQQNNSDCSRVAQHTLVLGLGGNVQPDPILFAQSVQPSHSTMQPDSSRKSGKTESSCLAPRASAIKEQGFSEAVVAQIEAPQRGSTRSVYKAKWINFYKVVPQ